LHYEREIPTIRSIYQKKRLADPRELSMKDIGDHLGFTQQYISLIENCNKRPFDGELLEKLAAFLNLTEEETALMFDLASRENHGVPYDIADTFMHEEVGDLIRYATRQTKAGFIKEEDWKTFIRQKEAERNGTQEGG
jgi:transcriptional regulator with XRE-family HTH domain